MDYQGSLLGSIQDRANCFTHKKALFIVDQNSVGFIGSPISLDEIDWNFKKRAEFLTSHGELPLQVKFLVIVLSCLWLVCLF